MLIVSPVRTGERLELTVSDDGTPLKEDLSGGFAYDRFDARNIQPPTPLFSRDVYSMQRLVEELGVR